MEEWTQAQRFRNKLGVAGLYGAVAVLAVAELYFVYLWAYPSGEPGIFKWLEGRVSVQFVVTLAIMFLVWSVFDRFNQIEKTLTEIKEELKKKN